MRYMTIQEHYLENAYRHESKGLWWTEQGFDEYAKGSFRKAARNYRNAKLLEIPESYKSICDLMASLVAKSIMEGSASNDNGGLIGLLKQDK